VRTLAVVVAIAALSTPALAGPPTAARCDQPPAPAGRGVRAIDWCRAEVGVWGGPLVAGGRPHRLTALPIGTPVDDLVVRRGVVTLVSGPDRATTRWRWDRRRQALVERVR
jgi:hypothetical protein